MDQTIFNFILGGVSTVLGWFLREMWSAVKELKADLAKLREELPREYVAKDDYRQDVRDLKEMLQKLFDRLEHKADKHGGD
jgi:predicted  nucleic acid-binding Zn-ribbon protein